MLSLPTRAFVHANPLGSPRLQLFPVDRKDAHELWLAVDESRDHLSPWLSWIPFQYDESSMVRFADACMADWDLGRALRMVIRERSSGTFVGVVGLETCVHMHGSCELGYWLRQPAEGRGYMTEAAALLVRTAFQQYKMHRIRVAASTMNHRSLAVIVRLGFRFEGIAREAEYCAGRWLDHAQFGMLATDVSKTK